MEKVLHLPKELDERIVVREDNRKVRAISIAYVALAPEPYTSVPSRNDVRQKPAARTEHRRWHGECLEHPQVFSE
jgi:hypothetical protein